MRVINFTNNVVVWSGTQTVDSFSVYGLDRLRSVSQGTGAVYFYLPSMGSGRRTVAQQQGSFFLSQARPAECSAQVPGGGTFNLERPGSASSGVITVTAEGFLMADSLVFDVADGRDLVVMRFRPRTTLFSIGIGKNDLSVDDVSGSVLLSSSGDELRCSGSVSGEFKAAKLVLDRRVGLPVYARGGFEETLV